jgi:threonylcarbamoyladenosine tRNA methylthiotransferase MtaB
MTTFVVHTLGCRVNQSESESLEKELDRMGYQPAGKDIPADICIINTCTVTQRASMQSRQLIRQVIRANPAAEVIVTGCYAQAEPEVIQQISGVHHVVGNDVKSSIPDRFCRKSNRSESGCAVDTGHLLRQRTRPFLKVQDGCNAFCSYCIVPYTRGRSRSLPLESVLSAITRFSEDGYHEIVLTGIHLGQYGLDLTPRTSLMELLRVIDDARLMDRIRLSSIEPLEVTDDIIGLVAASPAFCHHFHIPLQSGDNEVLKRMNRPYTREVFHHVVSRIHDLIPDAAIGADVLAGFPGETETAYGNTLALLQDLPITYLHVFPFSPRKGTSAYHFPEPVPHQVVQSRCRELRILGKERKDAFYRRHIGKHVTVLVEAHQDHGTRLFKGMTSNYMPVFINAGSPVPNTLATVEITSLYGDQALCGRIL